MHINILLVWNVKMKRERLCVNLATSDLLSLLSISLWWRQEHHQIKCLHKDLVFLILSCKISVLSVIFYASVQLFYVTRNSINSFLILYFYALYIVNEDLVMVACLVVRWRDVWTSVHHTLHHHHAYRLQHQSMLRSCAAVCLTVRF